MVSADSRSLRIYVILSDSRPEVLAAKQSIVPSQVFRVPVRHTQLPRIAMLIACSAGGLGELGLGWEHGQLARQLLHLLLHRYLLRGRSTQVLRKVQLQIIVVLLGGAAGPCVARRPAGDAPFLIRLSGSCLIGEWCAY